MKVAWRSRYPVASILTNIFDKQFHLSYQVEYIHFYLDQMKTVKQIIVKVQQPFRRENVTVWSSFFFKSPVQKFQLAIFGTNCQHHSLVWCLGRMVFGVLKKRSLLRHSTIVEVKREFDKLIIFLVRSFVFCHVRLSPPD